MSIKVKPKVKRNKDIEIEIDEDDAGVLIIKAVSNTVGTVSDLISGENERDTDNNEDAGDSSDSRAPTSTEMKNRHAVHVGRNINSELNAGLG